ncbi:MAG: hypothetical protein HUU01_23155 [Saprospiraceae bacterium]|nr:hypothetical protein [Saprospiraceae bacterium]
MTATEIPVSQKKITSLLDRLLDLIHQQPLTKDGLGLGRSSISLLNLYYGRFFDDEKYLEKGIRHIEEIFENITNQESSIETIDYYRGLIGFVLVMSHLKNHGFFDLDFEEFEEFDEAIFNWAYREINEGNIDFLAGSSGALCYFSDRLKGGSELSETSRATLSGYVGKLLASIWSLVENEETDRFFIVNRHYNKVDKRLEKEINYSLAHGMSGLLLNLLNLREQPEFEQTCDALLRPAIQTILSLQSSKEHPEPYFFINCLDNNSGKSNYQQRIGWCYSDLNLLHVLFRAEKAYGPGFVPQSLLEAASIAVTNRKSHEHTMLDDPFLCHGYAGVAHYYLVLHQLTQKPVFKEASDYWMEHAIEFYETHDNAWFFTKEYTATGNCLSLFYGNVGVCLCLLSAIYPESSTWSEIILIQ